MKYRKWNIWNKIWPLKLEVKVSSEVLDDIAKHNSNVQPIQIVVETLQINLEEVDIKISPQC